LAKRKGGGRPNIFSPLGGGGGKKKWWGLGKPQDSRTAKKANIVKEKKTGHKRAQPDSGREIWEKKNGAKNPGGKILCRQKERAVSGGGGVCTPKSVKKKTQGYTIWGFLWANGRSDQPCRVVAKRRGVDKKSPKRVEKVKGH